MKTHKCELGTQFCRGKATQRVRPQGKGAPKLDFWACMACVAILKRNGLKFKPA